MNESADKLDDERVALLRRIDALEAIEPLTGDALLERENSLKLLLMAYLPVIRRALAGIALPETQPLTGDTPRTDAALKKALEIAGAAKDASAKTMLTAFLTSIKVDMVQLECELAETHAAWDETSAALNAEVDRRIKAESALSAIGPSSAPVAWLYQLGKPGKRVTFASVDPNDPTEWPKEQWTNGYKVSPLYTAPVSTTGLSFEQVRDAIANRMNSHTISDQDDRPWGIFMALLRKVKASECGFVSATGERKT